MTNPVMRAQSPSNVPGAGTTEVAGGVSTRSAAGGIVTTVVGRDPGAAGKIRSAPKRTTLVPRSMITSTRLSPPVAAVNTTAYCDTTWEAISV